jgi:hypothetical protein
LRLRWGTRAHNRRVNFLFLEEMPQSCCQTVDDLTDTTRRSMAFHAVSLVVGIGWSVNLCIDCVRPLFGCVHLDPPSRAIHHPFHLKEKNLCPPSLQTTPLPAKYAALSQLSSPFFFFFFSLRTLFYLFLRKILRVFLFFSPIFLLFVPRGKREIHILHISLYPPPSFSLVLQHLFSLVSHSLLSIFSIYLFFFTLFINSLFSSIFRTTDFSILRIMRPFCSSVQQVTNGCFISSAIKVCVDVRTPPQIEALQSFIHLLTGPSSLSIGMKGHFSWEEQQKVGWWWGGEGELSAAFISRRARPLEVGTRTSNN